MHYSIKSRQLTDVKVKMMEERHHLMLVNILKSYLSEAERIFVYGSRAKGEHRRFSDLDLAIAGDIDSLMMAKLKFDLEDSDLPFQVDVHRMKDFSEAFLKLIEGDFVELKLD